MTTDQNPDFDGCNSECRKAGKHSLRWGGCEQATPPEPTVSMSVVYMDTDGGPSIGFDTYTVPELARLIEPVLGDPLKAAAAARRIVHRHDEQLPAVPSAAAPPTQADEEPSVDRVKAIAEAIGPTMLLGLQDAELFDEPGAERIRDWIKWISETVTALPVPAPVDRAAVLAEAIAAIEADELCHKPAHREHYANLLRRLAEAPQPETQARPAAHEWFVETRMIDGYWSKYGASRDTAADGRELFERDTTGSGKVHAFRLVHATTTYAVEAEHTPAVVAQPGKENS